MSRAHKTTMTPEFRIGRLEREAARLGLAVERIGNTLKIDANGRRYVIKLRGRTTVCIEAFVKPVDGLLTMDALMYVSDASAEAALQRIARSSR